ncbi:hypothetical protein NP233_g7952 [Leucocoprinus birnbaumii]|uniref:NACHT domain-containing protein n=1 Tax=Leucocoprinus birnbaumii TaxID=56174 RepID=A0AAD5VN75_9AGAR|nr:hypothetical protein NP233_g7952 [Leucocoprinus birnbaumii]
MSCTDPNWWFPASSGSGRSGFDADGGDSENQYTTNTTPLIINSNYSLFKPTVPSSFYQGIRTLPLSPINGLQVHPNLDGATNPSQGITEETINARPPLTTHSNVAMQGTFTLSDFIMNNPIMITDNTNKSSTDTEMMKLLEQKAMVDATFDSSARQYTAPHCHSETRVPLRKKATAWIEDMNREESLFWLYGPAGVGKSAVAQFLMEYCSKHGFVVAGIFLSRANKRNDASRIIPSLAHQLALSSLPYRQFVIHLLKNNPSILHKRLSIQFNQLIDEPANIFKATNFQGRPKPILLLLDGLDECNDEAAQRELIQLILPFSMKCKARRIPLVWVLTSRPEWQIVSTFNGFNSEVWREELPMDTPEARRDVAIVLRDRFTRIREKYSDTFSTDDEWPTDTQIRLINSAASGNMLLASIVVDFVDNDDPHGSLDLCLKFFEGKLTSNERNPFDPLAAFYRGMLLSIPPSLLRKTLLMLYFQTFALKNDAQPSILDIASFFLIDRATFYNCMRRLRSVVSIPSSTDTKSLESDRGLQFSHASFSDYLKVSLQVGTFGLHETDVHDDIRVRCIQWYMTLTDIELGRSSTDDLSAIIPWGTEHPRNSLRCLVQRLLFSLWEDLFNAGNFERLQDEMHDFLFNLFPCICHGLYLHNLESLADKLLEHQIQNPTPIGNHIVRTQPFWPRDYQLLSTYASIVSSWGASLAPYNPSFRYFVRSKSLWFELYSIDKQLDDTEAASTFETIQWSPVIGYFLLGIGSKTALVAVYPWSMDESLYWQQSVNKIKARYAFQLGDDGCYLLHRLITTTTQVQHYGNHPEDRVWRNSLACTIVSFIFHSLIAIRLRRLSRAVFLEMPREIFKSTRQILAFFICSKILPETDLDACDTYGIVHSKDLASFLDMDLDMMRKALHWLRPFVYWWSPSFKPQSIFMAMRIPASASIFRGRPARCVDHWRELGHDPYFCLDEEDCIRIFEVWARWASRHLMEGLDFFPNSTFVFEPDFLLRGWSAIWLIHTSSGFARVLNVLSEFPFCRLNKYESLFGEEVLMYRSVAFTELVCRLSDPHNMSINIMRAQPICEVDELLLKKFEKELELRGYEYEFAEFPITRQTIESVSLGLVSLCPEDPSGPKKYNEAPASSEHTLHVFFLSLGENTCLITMVPYWFVGTWVNVESGRAVIGQAPEGYVPRDEANLKEIQKKLAKLNNDCQYLGPPKGPWSWNMSVNETQ